MDASAWTAPLLDVEPDRFGKQLALKEGILAADPAYYFQYTSDAEGLAWEALELLLDGAARDWPEFFRLERVGEWWTWENDLRGETTRFRPGVRDTLPRSPLDWLGRQFQEDLILMAAGAGGEAVCAAGMLCFGSGWCLADKIGKPFLEVHAHVPGFKERAGGASDLLLRRLKAGRPVGRWNWTFPATGRLNLAPVLAQEWAREREGVTPDNAGDRCFLRTERQTLSRLPRAGGVLFTVHTYLAPISGIAADPEDAGRLLAHVRSLSPSMLGYRGMTGYADALIAYLESAALRGSDSTGLNPRALALQAPACAGEDVENPDAREGGDLLYRSTGVQPRAPTPLNTDDRKSSTDDRTDA